MFFSKIKLRLKKYHEWKIIAQCKVQENIEDYALISEQNKENILWTRTSNTFPSSWNTWFCMYLKWILKLQPCKILLLLYKQEKKLVKESYTRE